MLMPGSPLPPLPGHLQAIRVTVMALPIDERRQLMSRLHGDISRENDERHNAAADHAERERSRRRPDSRQMVLREEAA